MISNFPSTLVIEIIRIYCFLKTSENFVKKKFFRVLLFSIKILNFLTFSIWKIHLNISFFVYLYTCKRIKQLNKHLLIGGKLIENCHLGVIWDISMG